MESTRAILLRRIRYSESSLIITWLTEDHGKLKTIAKGAQRPKSSFAGVLDLFHETEISFARSSRSELHTLREARLLNPHEALRLDYDRLSLAAYFVELLERSTESDHPVPELFDLFGRAIVYLEREPANRRALLHFERELARLLGLAIGGSAVRALERMMESFPESRSALFNRLS